MPEDIILSTGPLGGLGDAMLYTTLPERFSKLGHKVYVDRDNLFRNDEIGDLLFAMNPFVLGSSDKKPNAGYVNQGRFYSIANKFPIGAIEAMERAHDLPPPYSLAPKIYYESKPFTQDLRDVVLVDFSAVSSAISSDGIREHLIEKMNERFTPRQAWQVTFPKGIVGYIPGIEGPSIRVNSLYEYVDALASCYAWVGSEGGGQALAAAVRGEHRVDDMEARPEIVCVMSTKTYNSRGYTFAGVDYRVTINSSNSNGDYWAVPEQAYERYKVMCRHSVEEARTIWASEKAARDAVTSDGLTFLSSRRIRRRGTSWRKSPAPRTRNGAAIAATTTTLTAPTSLTSTTASPYGSAGSSSLTSS